MTIIDELIGKTIKSIDTKPGAWNQGECGMLIFTFTDGLKIEIRDVGEEAEGLMLTKL